MLLNLILSLESWTGLGVEGTESRELKKPKCFIGNAMESVWCDLCFCDRKLKNYRFKTLNGMGGIAHS